MATDSHSAADHAARARVIAFAGWFILLLAAGAALLPVISKAHGALIIGAMLALSGAAEVIAGSRRLETKKLAMLAGAITMAAGLFFATEEATGFLPALVIIAGWLFLRSIVLLAAFFLEHGSVRRWTGIAAATDFALALITAAGMSIATLVVMLFATREPFIASFAWLLAISFVATSMLLLEVANCARSEDV
ncbi:hypothetical protein H9L12_09725 [Sphingomonas rhizophila]|jgi:uncharacterized membrane protein HdeD (DUF308 family)|uniref:Uncharacterized protein n=1 Tax=Sphingomonas rhizophila TaxID=2071607 RepID=A0A7G9S9Q0_9SPHN|nr:hypothetical protein [Sphingomonas rhizophila]QNN64575.1 hypothetical protein H9L12_09725 [Sphingomonas rhizophila]